MQDGIIAETGNSRLLKCPATIPTTFEGFRTALIAGTLPIDLLFNAAGWTKIGTPQNVATFLKEATAALYGLTSAAVPDGVLAIIPNKIGAVNGESIVRDLNIMLNLSLGTSNVDAWADLLTDSSMINTGASTYYTLADGKIKTASIQQLTDGGSGFAMGATGSPFIAQTFKASFTALSSVSVKIAKYESPADKCYCEIYSLSGGVPNASIATSTNQVTGSSLSSSPSIVSFTFSGVSLTAGTSYALVLKRTGSPTNANYYNIYRIDPSAYPDGSVVVYNGSAWSQYASSDLYFNIQSGGPATVIWKTVTATEAFAYAAITADETEGTGSIAYYLSDDGTNWTKITALNTSQAVNFDATSTYLKAVITENAELLGVAWGGY